MVLDGPMYYRNTGSLHCGELEEMGSSGTRNSTTPMWSQLDLGFARRIVKNSSVSARVDESATSRFACRIAKNSAASAQRVSPTIDESRIRRFTTQRLN